MDQNEVTKHFSVGNTFRFSRQHFSPKQWCTLGFFVSVTVARWHEL